jgi:TRAP-type mannitol/chloroaromatic compound transport system permease small subunit
MLELARKYVRVVDATNYRIGRVIMYGIFVMVGILLWSSISKTFFLPSRWTLEVAQFAMVAYYILGGPYSIQLGANVRMDLFYGEWTDRRKAQVDAITVLFLMTYLGVLLYGAFDSTAYSLGKPYNMESFTFFKNLFIGFFTGGFEGAQEVIGRLERSATAWRPYLWPIKVTMIIGIILMLLQAISELIKDIAKIKGVAL